MPETAVTSVKKSRRVSPEADLVYKQQFETFVRSTDQKQRQIQKVKEIMKGLLQRRTFLDVGAGSGEITEAIAGYFRKTVLVEPNLRQMEKLGARIPGAVMIHDTIECARLNVAEVDLALCSHVLYYVPESKWMQVIEKMFSCLNARGKLVLVLQSPEGGVPLFFKKFTGKSVNSIGLWARLVRRYGEDNVRAHYGIAGIQARTLEDMTSIGQFLLIDKKYRRKKSRISRYFRKHHRVSGGYQINQEYITFEITK